LKGERKLSWAIINNQIEKQLLELSQMKFKDPRQSKEELQNTSITSRRKLIMNLENSCLVEV
jgi:hypothetical protein